MKQDDELKRIARASKFAAGLSLLAFLVVAGVIGYSTVELNSVESTIVSQKSAVDSLKTQIAQLETTIQELIYAPKATPHVHAEILPGIQDVRGRQLYDFTLWFDVAAFQDKEIKQVKYRADSPLFQEVTATERSNGFSVYFRGPECLEKVTVEIRYSNDQTEEIDFNMCEALGW